MRPPALMSSDTSQEGRRPQHAVQPASGSASASASGLSIDLFHKIPHILPHERVFPIQIGSELFKLSGASLSSDGTSGAFRVYRHRLFLSPSKPGVLG